MAVTPTDKEGMIKPDGDESVLNFPGQNSFNMDHIDGVFRNPSLTSYTPDIETNGTQPNLGAEAVRIGYYYQILDFVVVWAYIKYGSTNFDRGSGNYGITLPVAINMNFHRHAESSNMGSCLGQGFLQNDSNSSASQLCSVTPRDGGEQVLMTTEQGAAGSLYVDATDPYAQGANDGISIYCMYRVA